MKVNQFICAAREAERQTGKSLRAQLGEVVHLRRKSKLFGISDYFDYRLFDDQSLSMAEKEEFAGWRMESWLDDRLNPRQWRGVVADKLYTYAILSAAGLRIPETVAIYHPGRRTYAGATTLSTRDALAEYLREAAPYPIFVKPVVGNAGSGAARLEGRAPGTDDLVLGDGSRRPVAEFVEAMTAHRPGMQPRCGYVLQTPIVQHPAVEAVAGSNVSSLRIMVLNTDEGPRLFRCMWRIVCGQNMTDHFSSIDSMDTGNLLASIDVDSGRCLRVIAGFGLRQRHLDTHPNTGASLRDFEIPDWSSVNELVTSGAQQFPMLRFQHWDVALSTQGPLALEMNTGGSINTMQYATGRGIFDADLRRLIDEGS